MKKRIKEVIDSEGVSRFYIQEKYIIWWTYKYPTFMCKESAEKWMDYRSEYSIKYH